MKNFIFISPNFPTNYWQFCHELQNNGMNVLGIGDQPYDELMPELKESLNEYYKVGSLENYDEVYRAVAFFAFKYGKIDWLESNNEYWLEQDARLRTDFNINTGFHLEDIPRIKYKSKMKPFYQKAGITMSMERQSSRRWVADSTGQVSSDQAMSTVCPTDRSTTGYLRWRMLSTTIRAMRANSPASIRWSRKGTAPHRLTMPPPP